MNEKNDMKSSTVHVMVAILAALSYLVGWVGFASEYWFAIVTVGLLAYVAYQVYCVAVIDGDARWMIKPPVMASLYTFVITYGITNVILFTSDGREAMERLGINYTWLSRTEGLALLGAVFMWFGYRRQIGSWAGNRLRTIFRLDVLFSKSWEVQWLIIWLCISTSFGARLAMIQLGIYG